jgi:hypothetical protein
MLRKKVALYSSEAMKLHRGVVYSAGKHVYKKVQMQPMCFVVVVSMVNADRRVADEQCVFEEKTFV